MQAEKLVCQALEVFGHIDILVNNAGGDIGARTPRPDPNDALDIDPDDVRSVIDRNLLTTMYTGVSTCASDDLARSLTWDQ